MVLMQTSYCFRQEGTRMLTVHFNCTIGTNHRTWLTHLLTPWIRVLIEKLVVTQLVKKFPAIYGTKMFITMLTLFR